MTFGAFLVKGKEGGPWEGTHGARRHERIRESNIRSARTVIREVSHAVSHQAKERIGGTMLAPFRVSA